MDDAAEKQQELALKKYTPILAYLATECTMFWNRSQLFLVAHSALLGFIGKDLPTPKETDLAKLGIFMVWAAAGLVLSGLWHLAITVGSKWVDWWTGKLVTLEADAFGPIELWRKRPQTPVRARMVARLAASLFTCLWFGLLVYLVILCIRALKCS
jgi:hypothetical protein